VPPETELTVVPEGIPVPLTACPEATVLGKVPVIVTVGEVDVVVARRSKDSVRGWSMHPSP